MKLPSVVPFGFLAAVVLALPACATSTPEQQRARKERIARERVEWREANFQYFLEDYAHRLGKAVSELNEPQREEARKIFNRDHPE